MTATGVIWLAYAVGFFVAWGRLAAQIVWAEFRTNRRGSRRVGEPDLDDWIGGILGGFIAALFWPLAVPLLVGRRWLLAPPADIKAQRQADRIRELERELGIGEGR